MTLPNIGGVKRKRQTRDLQHFYSGPKVNFGGVGKPRSSRRYLFHATSLDNLNTDQESLSLLTLELPQLSNIGRIGVKSLSVPDSIYAGEDKYLFLEIKKADETTVKEVKLPKAHLNNNIEVLNRYTELLNQDVVNLGFKLLIELDVNKKVTISVTDFNDATITAVSIVFNRFPSDLNVSETYDLLTRYPHDVNEFFGFGRSTEKHVIYKQADDSETKYPSPNPGLYLGQQFMLLRLPGININSTFGAYNKEFWKTNILAKIPNTLTMEGAHFNADWFHMMTLHNKINMLNMLELELYHPDGRPVNLNGGIFAIELEIEADSNFL